MNNCNTLLITGSINIESFAVPFTTLIKVEDRLHQYLESIKYAITNYHKIQNIIFCDNTNYPYDYSQLYELAHDYNKTLEVLTFEGDYYSIVEHGKGFGEGEIIEYTMNNSFLISKCFSFFKLTGRLIVKNMDQMVQNEKEDNLFISQPSYMTTNNRPFIHTVFYKVNCKFYKNNLLHVYKPVSDKDDFFLEHAFYAKLIDTDERVISFRKYPIIQGQSGTTGERYDNSNFGIFKQNIYSKFGVYNLTKTNLQKIFTFIIKYISLFLK